MKTGGRLRRAPLVPAGTAGTVPAFNEVSDVFFPAAEMIQRYSGMPPLSLFQGQWVKAPEFAAFPYHSLYIILNDSNNAQAIRL